MTAGDVGSSPRGRGKPHRLLKCRVPHGLIPARAGKTGCPARYAGSSSAHPRAGGENDAGGHAAAVGPGLIPARAGKTRRRLDRRPICWAHPRAGGENLYTRNYFYSQLGSSPRGRGKHFLTCAFIKQIGQILETLELAVSSGSYSLCDVYATHAPQDQARNTGLALPSSRAAS